MKVSTANAVWNGTLKEGNGTMKLGSESAVFPFTYASRFEEGKQTNPEELIGAAQAGCFSMFLAALLGGDGYAPRRIATSARVHLAAGPTITLIELETEVEVANIAEATLLEYVEKAKKNCPVSKALASVEELRVKATLKG
jgi:osmotically inducible protein OsmC